MSKEIIKIYYHILKLGKQADRCDCLKCKSLNRVSLNLSGDYVSLWE